MELSFTMRQTHPHDTSVGLQWAYSVPIQNRWDTQDSHGTSMGIPCDFHTSFLFPWSFQWTPRDPVELPRGFHGIYMVLLWDRSVPMRFPREFKGTRGLSWDFRGRILYPWGFH